MAKTKFSRTKSSSSLRERKQKQSQKQSQKVVINIQQPAKAPRKPSAPRAKKTTEPIKTKEEPPSYYKGLSPGFGGYVAPLYQTVGTQTVEMEKIFKPLVETTISAIKMIGSNSLGQQFSFSSNPNIENLGRLQFFQPAQDMDIRTYVSSQRQADEDLEDELAEAAKLRDLQEENIELPAAEPIEFGIPSFGGESTGESEQEEKPKRIRWTEELRRENQRKKKLLEEQIRAMREKEAKKEEPPFFTRIVRPGDIGKLSGETLLRITWTPKGYSGPRTMQIKAKDYEEVRQRLRVPIKEGGLGQVSDKNIKIFI